MNKYNIILADDHELVRKGIKKLINDSNHDFKIISEASNGLELLDKLKKIQVSMAIVDVSMPKIRGIEATSEINLLYPEIDVIIMSSHRTMNYLREAIRAGANGYLLKEDSVEELFKAIQSVRNGNIYISKLLAGELPSDFSDLFTPEKERRLKTEILSYREKIIIRLVSDGNSNGDIANHLNLSKRTVENHRSRIITKLNLNCTADLIKYAIKNELTEL